MRACVQCVSHMCGTYTHMCVTNIKDFSLSLPLCACHSVCVCVSNYSIHTSRHARSSMIAHGV